MRNRARFFAFFVQLGLLFALTAVSVLGQVSTATSAAGIVCSNRHDGLRLSFHVYNTQSDVASVLGVLEGNLDLLATGAAPVSAG